MLCFHERLPDAEMLGIPMKPRWLSDARLIPDDVMSYLRKIAVHAVQEEGQSPEEVIKILGFDRSCIYDWLNRFREAGYDGLDTKKAPGSPARMTSDIDAWLKQVLLESSPEDHGYDTTLWTCGLLADLVEEKYGIQVVPETINHHLHQMGLSYQKPGYIAREQDAAAVEQFVTQTVPKIQRLAEKVQADIGFEDEAAVDLRDHYGKTWGARGVRPEVFVTGKHGRVSILSVVTPEGGLRFHATENRINSDEYIQFLTQLMSTRTRPLFLIVDRAPFHTSRKVRIFIWRNRRRIRLFYLPSYSPELNPDEHVWEEIKDKRLGRQVIKNKAELKKRVHSALRSLQRHTERVISFFHLPETQYAVQ
jgi:transposase